MFVGIFYLLVNQGSTQEDNWKDLDHVTENCPGEGQSAVQEVDVVVHEKHVKGADAKAGDDHTCNVNPAVEGNPAAVFHNKGDAHDQGQNGLESSAGVLEAYGKGVETGGTLELLHNICAACGAQPY